MEKQKGYSAMKSAEANVRHGKAKTGSYIGAVKDLQSTVNLQDHKNRKAKRAFKKAELLALHKKAKQITR
jgi:hypothetical protein